jgi:hypothetical protein
VPDTWPPPGPQKREPLLEYVHDVWTLHGIQSNCTAAIYRNDFGLELRGEHGGELIESRLSRHGEAPLLLIADEVKANLIAQGWCKSPQRRIMGEDDATMAPVVTARHNVTSAFRDTHG